MTTKKPFDGIWNLSAETRELFLYRMLGVIISSYRELPSYAKKVLQESFDQAIDEEVQKITKQITVETPK